MSYLRIIELGPDRIVLDSGGGPLVPGQTHNTAYFRVAASLLSAIASAMRDVVVVIIIDHDPKTFPSPWYVRGGGTIDQLSPDTMANTQHTGWLKRHDKQGAIFVFRDREAIEECLFNFSVNARCYIVNESIRAMANEPDRLEKRAADHAECEVSASWSDVEVRVTNERWLNVLVEKNSPCHDRLQPSERRGMVRPPSMASARQMTSDRKQPATVPGDAKARADRHDGKRNKRTADLQAFIEAMPGAEGRVFAPGKTALPLNIIYKVMGKMFAILSLRGVEDVIVKCDPDLVLALRAKYTGIGHRSHLDERFWISVRLDENVPIKEVRRLVSLSYELVCATLTRKQRAQLALLPPEGVLGGGILTRRSL